MLDKNYYPMYLYKKDFLSEVATEKSKTLDIAIEREDGFIKTFSTMIFKDNFDKNINYVERIIKTLLWCFGGYKIYISEDEKIYLAIKDMYCQGGAREFDKNLMEQIYLKPFQVVLCNQSNFPKEKEKTVKVGGDFMGNRIGFDAGGSDRKVTACVNGEVKFMEETVWFPKKNSDPEYHIDGIDNSIKLAIPHLPTVDCIGVSTAGIVVDDEIRVASLFRLVPEEKFSEKIVPIYKNLAKKYNCPVKVANDGDVSALAGSIYLKEGKVLGVAMGTSLAVGYVDNDGNIKGYINELAFVPVDANKTSAIDEWSGDYGVGVMYMSQDGVIKLMDEANMEHDGTLSPAEKLKVAQNLVNSGDPAATEIFKRVGQYFGYSIMWYSEFYDISKVLFLGRVASGKGGDLVLDEATKILNQYSKGKIQLVIPDEKFRRLGQSYTACSLVNLKQ